MLREADMTDLLMMMNAERGNMTDLLMMMNAERGISNHGVHHRLQGETAEVHHLKCTLTAHLQQCLYHNESKHLQPP